MRIALVDDDADLIEVLKGYIEEALSILGDAGYRITTFASGEAFLETFSENQYDLIVLDIFMGKLTGIEVAYRIREKDTHVMLAFCTSSNEYASESYDVGACNYLRKPISRQSIAGMFRRMDLETIERNRAVKLPDGKNVVLQKILYTEYENHVVSVYLKDAAAHRLRTSHAEIETLLMANGEFFSPYKGILVNLRAVESVSEDSCRLVDNTVLPITRRRQKEFKDAYNRFRFQLMRKEVGL